MKWNSIETNTYRPVKRVRIVFFEGGNWEASKTDLPMMRGVVYLDETLTLSQINEAVKLVCGILNSYENNNNKYI